MKEPWGGQSPRDLTREGKRRILKAGAVEKHERFGFGEQLELWPELTRRGPVYDGAPSLLPLPEVMS